MLIWPKARETLVIISHVILFIDAINYHLQFGAISNHSDWGTFSELKYNLSCIFFKTISIFRISNNCFIVCPKHTFRCDLVFMYE